MKLKCKYCGDEFTPSQEDLDLAEDGWIILSQICDDCALMQDSFDYETDVFSDADPGW